MKRITEKATILSTAPQKTNYVAFVLAKLNETPIKLTEEQVVSLAQVFSEQDARPDGRYRLYHVYPKLTRMLYPSAFEKKRLTTLQRLAVKTILFIRHPGTTLEMEEHIWKYIHHCLTKVYKMITE